MSSNSQIHKLSQFPIGFWSYTNFDQIGPEAVKDYVDCGMTIVQTPRFRPGETRVEEMIVFLCPNEDSNQSYGNKNWVLDSKIQPETPKWTYT